MKSVLTVAVLGLIGFAALPALSDDNGAVVVKDGFCNLYDGNGVLTLTTSSISVTNHGGVTVLKCSAKGLPNDTGAAAHFDAVSQGVPCGTAGGFTDDWSNTVSASGNSTLTCRINN